MISSTWSQLAPPSTDKHYQASPLIRSIQNQNASAPLLYRSPHNQIISANTSLNHSHSSASGITSTSGKTSPEIKLVTTTGKGPILMFTSNESPSSIETNSVSNILEEKQSIEKSGQWSLTFIDLITNVNSLYCEDNQRTHTDSNDVDELMLSKPIDPSRPAKEKTSSLGEEFIA